MARLAFTAMIIGALLGPGPADAQLVAGVFGARARDSFGGTNGFGAEVGVSLPLIPIEVFGAGTFFNPDCTGCDFKGWSLGVQFGIFPLPVIHPYLTFGRTWRNLEDPSTSLMLDGKGFFAGGGIELALPGFGIFGEGRYEFWNGDTGPNPDLRQWVLRAGLMMRWGGLPF